MVKNKQLETVFLKNDVLSKTADGYQGEKQAEQKVNWTNNKNSSKKH